MSIRRSTPTAPTAAPPSGLVTRLSLVLAAGQLRKLPLVEDVANATAINELRGRLTVRALDTEGEGPITPNSVKVYVRSLIKVFNAMKGDVKHRAISHLLGWVAELDKMSDERVITPVEMTALFRMVSQWLALADQEWQTMDEANRSVFVAVPVY